MYPKWKPAVLAIACMRRACAVFGGFGCSVLGGVSVSFSGIITFSKWAGDPVVRAIPDDRLLVETDAPYLAPVPVRGRRNEPRYIPYVITRLAAVRSSTPDALAALVTANAQRLFGLAIGAAP